MTRYQPHPKLDLVLERTVDVPLSLVWAAWTKPQHLKEWFTPAPWKTVECEIDLRPGGIFRTVFRSPEGQETPNLGCYLEVVEGQRLVWTNALGPNFRPQAPAYIDLPMTAMILMEAQGKGTRYTAIALHAEEKQRDKHKEMGFYDGWGAALDQLVALMKKKI